MKTFTTQVATAAIMMAQANSIMLETDPWQQLIPNLDPTAPIPVTLNPDYNPVYDHLTPEMIDEEGMLIWSVIAEDLERDRMAGVCEFCQSPEEAYNFLDDKQSIIRWAEFEEWVENAQQINPVWYAWISDVDYSDFMSSVEPVPNPEPEEPVPNPEPEEPAPPITLDDLVKIDLFGEATVTAEYARYFNNHSPAHLLEDSTQPWNKWFQNQSHDSWVTVDFQSVEHTIVGLGFESANDNSIRDPETVIVSIRDQDQPDSWKQVAALDLHCFGDNCTRRRFLQKHLIPETTTTEMRFDFHNPNIQIMQLAQIVFYSA